MNRQSIVNSPREQRGAVLVVSLLLLLVMTILALSATQTTRMQERMAGNMRDRDLAFQSAEAGLRAAEKYFEDWTGVNPPVPVATYAAATPVFTQQALPADLSSKDTTWWNNNSTQYGSSTTKEIANVNRDPQYVMEMLEFVCYTKESGCPDGGRSFYRLTSRAEGGTDTAVVVLQSTFARPEK